VKGLEKLCRRNRGDCELCGRTCKLFVLIEGQDALLGVQIINKLRTRFLHKLDQLHSVSHGWASKGCNQVHPQARQMLQLRVTPSCKHGICFG